MIYGDDNLDLKTVLHHNALRRQKQFKQALHDGAQWLVECRDLGDRFDEDAGVYFVPLYSVEEVNDLVALYTPDNEWDQILGIYALNMPLESQGSGLTRTQWLHPHDDTQTPDDATEAQQHFTRPPVQLSPLESFAVLLWVCAVLWLLSTIEFC